MDSRARRRFAFGAAALVASLTLACGSSAHARRVADDRRLGALVDERLTTSQALADAKVEAKSYSGVVALIGEVPDESVRREAEQLAASVSGVVRVNNMILVVKGTSRAVGSAPAKGAPFVARAD